MLETTEVALIVFICSSGVNFIRADQRQQMDNESALSICFLRFPFELGFWHFEECETPNLPTQNKSHDSNLLLYSRTYSVTLCPLVASTRYSSVYKQYGQ